MIVPRQRGRRGRRRRLGPVPVAGLSALVLLALAVAAALSLGDGPEQEPAASPAVLDRIARKNREAAVEAAAHMKAESAAVADAAEAHRTDRYEGQGGPEEPVR